MWYEIFKFELKYRAKRLDTYIFFIFLFLFSLVAVDFIYNGIDLGLVKKNAPIIIAKTMGALTGITLMIASLIMGVPILRDFEYNMESLMFVNPIKKRDYLLGRFLGSFVVLLIIFTALIWGNALGEFMPWRNPEDLLPYNFMVYVQPFFTVVIPILFFGSALFFVSGALSRKLIVVYTQALFTFVLFMLTRNIENEFLSAILDPFSLNTLSTMTDLWTTPELNSQLIPLTGVLLYSKLFWIAIGVIILIIGYKRFNYNVVKSKSYKKKKQAVVETEVASRYNEALPNFTIHQDFKSQCIQLLKHSLFYFKSILKEVSFWAIVICAMVIILINSISLGTVYGVDSFPATYFIIEELLEMSGYFFIIILVFYSGELIWKERGAKLSLIYDALPSTDFINLAGKFIGLILIYAVLMLSVIVSGVIFQSVNGYYKFELDIYFMSFFGDFLPFLILYTFMSFFIHVMVNKKFVAYMLVFTFFIGSVAMDQLGFSHGLYNFGGNNIGTYSSMNGYGHLLAPYLWIKAYWFVFCFILFIVSAIFSVRGTETSLIKRWKQAKQRLSKPLITSGSVAILIFIALGSFIFYNTNILNTDWTNTQQLEFRVGYEKNLKQFEYVPQPKITSVNLKVELYPQTRDYTAEGYYILTNNTKTEIHNVHVQKLIDSDVNLDTLTFEGGAILDEKYLEYSYYQYALNQAIQPGDSIKMSFKQSFTTRGFENGGSNSQIVNNGTFFNNKDLPTLGYNNKYELRDTDDREDFGFAPRKGMAHRNDLKELKNAVNGDDGYMINFEIVIGTDLDQTAIAPGTLVNQWDEGQRNYFHYKMEQPIINFYSIVSARYEVMKDAWIAPNDSLNTPVDLEIYYHKGHEYNIDRMMTSMKLSFDYFSTNFSPYPYQQMRIMEFPRYSQFAQSFPTAVPFSEGIGFMLDIDDETDVDMAFYITAHELAHQWWGLQVVAANVQGRYMILETLAQYSALMVLRQKYSEAKVQQFLQGELKSYFSGKAKEEHEEATLALVEKEEYIYYRKGAVNMYALQDYIGEDQVNLALKRFIKDWNAFGPEFNKERYATTIDLLGYFRAVTPDNLQYIITDLFETNTHYDTKVGEFTSTKLDDGGYKVDLNYTVTKYKTGVKGNRLYSDTKADSLVYISESLKTPLASLPLTDYVDVVVFGETDKDGEKTKIELYNKKHKITEIPNTLSIRVNQEPISVGVDPYHKLIDKNTKDNIKRLKGLHSSTD